MNSLQIMILAQRRFNSPRARVRLHRRPQMLYLCTNHIHAISFCSSSDRQVTIYQLAENVESEWPCSSWCGQLQKVVINYLALDLLVGSKKADRGHISLYYSASIRLQWWLVSQTSTEHQLPVNIQSWKFISWITQKSAESWSLKVCSCKGIGQPRASFALIFSNRTG